MWGPELNCMFEMWSNSGFVSWEDQFFVFVPEIAGNEPLYSVCRVVAFLCVFLPLQIFGHDDSQIPLLICCRQLLIGHVIVASQVVVSDVHHRTLINTMTTLKFISHLSSYSTSLLISSCSSVMLSRFLALWQSLVSSGNLDILLKNIRM